MVFAAKYIWARADSCSRCRTFFTICCSLKRLPTRLKEGNEYGTWVPFGCTVAVFILAFNGLAYSLFPFLAVDKIDSWQAASALELP
jgi:cytochrome bd ubiquinol oxidase subunit II